MPLPPQQFEVVHVYGLVVPEDRDDDGEADSRLGEVSVPTLVVVGADEDPYMTDQADRMTSQIPGASRVVIENAAHMIPLEQPGPLADAVTAFFERLA